MFSALSWSSHSLSQGKSLSEDEKKNQPNDNLYVARRIHINFKHVSTTLLKQYGSRSSNVQNKSEMKFRYAFIRNFKSKSDFGPPVLESILIFISFVCVCMLTTFAPSSIYCSTSEFWILNFERKMQNE